MSVHKEVKEKLDNVGCGMCLKKWTQVTLQLQSGHNHSCHHHQHIKFQQKRSDEPSALPYNSRYKKLRRREMLTGKRPKECDYCWNVEDNSSEFSDRVFKSRKLV